MPKAELPIPVKNLVTELKRLPGIGSRSAERMAVWLLRNKKAEPLGLAHAIAEAHEKTIACPVCGFFATRELCEICTDPKRDETLLCVVEQATDVLPLERSGAFKGRYHCLGGKLSPLDRVSPEDLNIPELMRRVDAAGEGMEIILALGADVEGEATSNYLADMLRGKSARVTRIAQGLPAGGGLEHADELTLMRAIQGRRDF